MNSRSCRGQYQRHKQRHLEDEMAAKGVTKVIYQDADGNEISFGGGSG